MYAQKMMAKAALPRDQYGALTPKKMLSWGILDTWMSRVSKFRAGGVVDLDAELSKLQQLILDEPQDPGELVKDYFMEGFSLANHVEHHMMAGAIYAQVIKGYMYEHIFQYHQSVYGRGEGRDWDQFVHEELGVRRSTAYEYRRLWLLIKDWVRFHIASFNF